ncbi:MAG: tail fiber domain-containing protein [Sphingobacteriaceae bacterium]|nr:MAG: tail fiber domain-containing protein [Sphingobacteriaceae bacterium]
MSDKKITELPLASSVSASDVSVLVNNGTDYQFAFASLLQLIGSSISVGASISFGTTLPQNTAGKNGDVFINTSSATFAQKISGAWTIVYALPASGGTTDGTVLYGIGVPNSSTGNNNDTYINTGTGIFYKKTAGTWNQVFSMQTGPAGAPGTPGSNGINGTNGFSILNGTGNPSNLSTGVNGDFYINTTTYTLFGPKTAGVWDNGISLIGEGVPIGGTSGQILSKASDDNFDVEWTDKFAGLNSDTITEALGFTPEDTDNKGVANGYASLDGTGKVPSSQLPSYVDDVIEVATFSSLPATGETGKIYITVDTNYEYRWSGSTYIRLVASPGSTDALAEGSSNLYFTFDRARSANSATSPIFYNPTSGVISSQPATSSQHGYLLSTDWSTFNSKQNTITLTTTGSTGVATLVGSTLNIPNYSSSTSGTQNYVSKFGAGGTTIGDSQIFDNGTMVGIGYATDPSSGNKFAVNGTAHIQSALVVKGMSYLDGNAQIRKTTTTTNTQFGFYMINAGGTAPGLAQAAGVLAESGTPWYASTELVFKVNPGPDVTANSAVEVMRLSKASRLLLGSATDLAISGVKLQVTGGIYSSTLTASQPVFTDANKQLVSVSVVPATNGGAGTISGIMKANGSGTVSAAVAGTDYIAPSTLSGYIPLSWGSGNRVTGDGYFANNKFIYARNVANSADNPLIGLNSSNRVSIDAGGIGATFGGHIDVTSAVNASYFSSTGTSSMAAINPQVNSTYNFGSTGSRWLNIYSVGADFSGTVTSAGPLYLTGNGPTITYTNTASSSKQFSLSMSGSNFFINEDLSTTRIQIAGGGATEFNSSVNVLTRIGGSAIFNVNSSGIVVTGGGYFSLPITLPASSGISIDSAAYISYGASNSGAGTITGLWGNQSGDNLLRRYTAANIQSFLGITGGPFIPIAGDSNIGNLGLGGTAISGGAAAKWITADGSSYGGGLISSVNGTIKGYVYYDNGSNSMVLQGGTGVAFALQANNTTIVQGSTTGIDVTGFIIFKNNANKLIGRNFADTQNVEILRISTSNNVSIDANGVGTVFGGTGVFAGNLTALAMFSSSDERLKIFNNNTYDTDLIRGTAFQWKNNSDYKNHYGYKAQEVMQYMPDAVSKDESGYLSVNYIEIHTVKIQRLEDRIAYLEQKLKDYGMAH